MSTLALNHLIDRQRHGAAGFAADAAFKGRVLQSIADLKMSVVAIAGAKGQKLKTPALLDLLPEEKRYLDPNYKTSEDFLTQLDEHGNQRVDNANFGALASMRKARDD